MRLREQLDAEARAMAAWLEAHASDFPPLKVVRVTPKVITDSTDESAIHLTTVLEDPPERGAGWADDALFGLIDAVNEASRGTEHEMYVYVLPVALSDQAA